MAKKRKSPQPTCAMEPSIPLAQSRYQQLLESENRLKTTRAGKLLLEGKNFVCIEEDEPYYLPAYRAIRQNAKRSRKWTIYCEDQFRAAVERWIDREANKEA